MKNIVSVAIMVTALAIPASAQNCEAELTNLARPEPILDLTRKLQDLEATYVALAEAVLEQAGSGSAPSTEWLIEFGTRTVTAHGNALSNYLTAQGPVTDAIRALLQCHGL